MHIVLGNSGIWKDEHDGRWHVETKSLSELSDHPPAKNHSVQLVKFSVGPDPCSRPRVRRSIATVRCLTERGFRSHEANTIPVRGKFSI